MLSTTLFAAPQAVIFDFGGVLTKEPNREAVISFLRHSFHLSAEEFEKVNLEKKAAIKAGKTDEEFWLGFAKQKEIVLSENWHQEFQAVMKEAFGINPEMFALIDELKANQVRVGLLSNIDERLAKLLRGWGLYKPFEPCLLSYELGIEKPDPRIYELLLKNLKLPGKEVVFIDDLIENVQSAKEKGIHAILFESTEQIRNELCRQQLLPEESSMSNQITLDSYELGVEPYVANTAAEVSGLFKEWIDKTLSLVAKKATILEIGSGFGRDARYIESKGYSVERTDATKGFIELLEKQGVPARHFNVLTHDFTAFYDLIYANAVFLHFTQAELETVLEKIAASLSDNGLLAFSVKPGIGEEWTSVKIGHPRYFCYWQKEPLSALLQSKGFDLVDIFEDETFLRLIAKKR